jgi:hypothetical protein
MAKILLDKLPEHVRTNMGRYCYPPVFRTMIEASAKEDARIYHCRICGTVAIFMDMVYEDVRLQVHVIGTPAGQDSKPV